MKNKTLETIKKTKEYLDYLEEHIINIQKAWKLISAKCRDMRFIYDDFFFWTIDSEINNHDLSKLSEHEFVQYRKEFYPTEDEDKDFKSPDAWKHHVENNSHHWQHWTTTKFHEPYSVEMACVHMVVDWVAMSYKFNDHAKDYYEGNKDEINLPDWAVKFIYEIFERIGNYHEAE